MREEFLHVKKILLYFLHKKSKIKEETACNKIFLKINCYYTLFAILYFLLFKSLLSKVGFEIMLNDLLVDFFDVISILIIESKMEYKYNSLHTNKGSLYLIKLTF